MGVRAPEGKFWKCWPESIECFRILFHEGKQVCIATIWYLENLISFLSIQSVLRNRIYRLSAHDLLYGG